jgi:TPR repeat protein
MASARVPLNLPSPIGSGEQPLMVTLTKTPADGTLWLGGSKVEMGAAIPADRLAELAYDRGSGTGTETIEYQVRTADGRTASTSINIVADVAAALPKEPVVAVAEESAKPAPAEKKLASAEKPPVLEQEAKPQLIAMAADVGTGFVGVANDWQTARDVGNGWLRLAKRTPGAQVALANKVLAPGDLVKEADVQHLSVRPPIADAGQNVEIALVPATPGGKAKAPVDIKVAVSVNDCDRLAAEPLDVQAVTEGVLPNEIDVPAALKACRKAVDAYPDVARFKYQFARALYADGQFDEAIRNLQSAYDQGHVRAGELLGRIYQLGLQGKPDPAKAVPLFEAGAKKGDPYAQYSLAKALIYGKGTKPDVERGMKLLVSAAESGHTYAMNQLGYEYRSGTHTKADPKRALTFFEKSVARQDVWGMLNLGLLYRDGVGVAKDSDRAMQLFRDADKGGQPAAATLIALMMQDEGKGGATCALPPFRRARRRLGRLRCGAHDRHGPVARRQPGRSDPSLRTRRRPADERRLGPGGKSAEESRRQGDRPAGAADAHPHGTECRHGGRRSRPAEPGSRESGARPRSAEGHDRAADRTHAQGMDLIAPASRHALKRGEFGCGRFPLP